MTESARCPQCGSPMDVNANAGLCPKCLLQAGFESQPGQPPNLPPSAASGTASGFEPPTVAELSAKLPQLEILELLGKGGMGAVYKARQPGLDRLVAVKILPPEVGRDPAFAERFAREARALARLTHPNIVAVHDFGQAGDLYYFVMELIEGTDLRQAMRAGQLQPQQALAFVPGICDALQYAHDEGVVHRDIKPENILLDKRGRVKIADFGLSKLMASGGDETSDVSLTGKHQVMGSIRYMAPEQMQGTKGVDHRADIYSLGVVFYEMLTGELPMGRFAPPSRRVQIDVRLDEVVLRALDSDPEQRYQQASDVKASVEMIQQSTAPSAGPSFVERISDRSYFRRLTIITLILPTLASPAFHALMSGYLAGADWYFKQEVPYTFLSAWWFTLSAMTLLFFVQWWYLLAKDPQTPRSFADFIRLTHTPDARLKRLWALLALFFVIWGAAIAISFVRFGDTANSIALSFGFVVAPYFLMFVTRRVYGPLRTPAEGQSRPRPMATPVHSEPRFSRFAILGAVLALFGVLAVIPVWYFIGLNRVWSGKALPTDLIYEQPPLVFSLLMGLLLAVGAAAPVGTTIYGAIAIRQIQRSGGKLIGLPLALADVLCFPLLLFGGLIPFLVTRGFLAFVPQSKASVLDSAMSLSVVVAALVCVFAARAAWRAIQPSRVQAVETTSTDSWSELEIGATAAVAWTFIIAAVKGICELLQRPSPLDALALPASTLALGMAVAVLAWHQFRAPLGARDLLPDLYVGLLAASAASLPWAAALPPILGWSFWQGAVFSSLNFVLSFYLLVVGVSHPRTRGIRLMLVGLVDITLVLWFNFGPVGVIGNHHTLSKMTHKSGLMGMYFAAALGLLAMITGALQLWRGFNRSRE